MGIRKKYKNTVEKFLSKDQGKRFFQFFYSFGAAIVIVGALAKLENWPGGSLLLTIGMITEFFVFIISAFDTPSKEYRWEEVFPVLDTKDAEDRPSFGSGGNGKREPGFRRESSLRETNEKSATGSIPAGNIIIGGTILGQGSPDPGATKQSFGIPSNVNISEEDTNALAESIKKMSNAAEQLGKMAELSEATQEYLNKIKSMSENMEKFSTVTNSLTDASDVLLNSYKYLTENSDSVDENSKNYVQQMNALNRNMEGLNQVYEMQLQTINTQMEALTRINSGLLRMKDMFEASVMDSSIFRSETEKMTQQIAALNGIYARLLNAMTMNTMYPGTGYNPGYNPGGYNPQPPYNPGQGYNPNPGYNPQQGNRNSDNK